MGTLGMTYDQKGRYVDLLCIQHQKGHIDADMFSQVLDGCLDGVVGKKFSVDDGGCYYNQRLETEIIKRKEYTAGRLKNLTGSAHMDDDMDTHMEAHMEAHTKDINKDTDSDSNQGGISLSERRFDEFWSTYPKKIGKKAAYASWKRVKVTEELHQTILAAIRLQKTGAQWQKDNGQYIPNPATWLNQGRWDDEVNLKQGQKSGKTVLEQQYTQREYDAKDYGGLTPEEVEEALKYDA